MNSIQDAKERMRRVRRRVKRGNFGSLRYLCLLLSLLLPNLVLMTQQGKLLGRYQIFIGVILYVPPLILGILIIKHQKRILKRGLQEQAICTKCLYDLTGNVSGRCSECGEEIGA